MNCDRLQNLTLRKGERLQKTTPKLGAFHSLLLINPLNEGERLEKTFGNIKRERLQKIFKEMYNSIILVHLKVNS